MAGSRIDGSTEGEPDILARGSTVGRYLVLERLGAGAAGVVYAAYDPKLDRKIALKLLRPRQGRVDDVRQTARLEREAQAIAKLSHPNIVGIFDVGFHQGQVFMAMEYLAGGTLRAWVTAQERPWREIVKMFIEVGKGLAVAHVEGLIHRDFKPDNVLLDKNGVPKVVDFGLVRLSSWSDPTADSEPAGNVVAAVDLAATLSAGPGPPVLTRTGALAGTPAYMAPEQFLGKPIDVRTDQFAFCVALYEALYGERPFAGETLIAVADAVTDGRVRDAPRDSDVPRWIRRIALRGILTDPARRYATLDPLLADLAKDPVAQLKRRIALALVALVVIAGVVAMQRRSERRRLEFERQIAALVTDGDDRLSSGLTLKNLAQNTRQRAFTAFDRQRRDDGENLWAQYLQLAAHIDETLQAAASGFSAALDLDSKRSDVKDRLLRALSARAESAEADARLDDLQLIRKQMRSLNAWPSPPWTEPATLVVSPGPGVASIALEEFTADGKGRLQPVPVPSADPTSAVPRAIHPGSYRLSIRAADGLVAYLPFQAAPGAVVRLAPAVPKRDLIPASFLLVSAGDFWFGDTNEDWRTSFLNTVPIHKRQCESFIIGTTEVPVSEWLLFLADLPPIERKLRAPAASNVHGGMALEQTGPASTWRYAVTVDGKTQRFNEGQPIIYSGRTGPRREADWRKLPVTGVSAVDVKAFLEWFKRRLPSARLCSELEWERAARGADTRNYPSSSKKLLPSDANIDATYGRIATAFGPDEVGSYSASTSPFGISDMAGNVWEMATSVLSPGELVLRGGSYYHGSIAAAVTNREPIETTTRSPVMGFRICGDAPPRM